jgi:hypothetical protein
MFVTVKTHSLFEPYAKVPYSCVSLSTEIAGPENNSCAIDWCPNKVDTRITDNNIPFFIMLNNKLNNLISDQMYSYVVW